MALDNMTTEPRREITETVVGMVAFGGVIWGDYLAAKWVVGISANPDFTGAPAVAVCMVIGIILAALGLVVTLLLIAFIHGLGDFLCGILEGWGLQMRPRQRYTRLRDGTVVPRN